MKEGPDDVRAFFIECYGHVGHSMTNRLVSIIPS
jgi:hypothetical protein